MTEPKEEKTIPTSSVHVPKSREFWTSSSGVDKDATFMMDLDLDLDNSWPFDQIFSANSNPTSPFLLSAATEQPFSPLWAFSDENNDEKPNGNVIGGCSGGGGLYPRFLSYAVNPDLANDDIQASEEKRKPPPPIISLKPMDFPDGTFIMKERMNQALRYFKDSSEQHVLAQVWAPVKNGGRYVLTTSGQPFVLDPNSNGLHQYRMVSIMYKFSVDGESDGVLGLPGRVFHQKLPEWTPNVQYYSSKEFPRLSHALNYNVQGTLALPVFEKSGQLCIGVLELIMTNQRINYAPELDKVCKALEAVNLKSSEILDQSNTQICNEGRQNALVEILEILTVVCETHNLPLAQTWVPCRHRSVLTYGGGLRKSCSSIDGSCMGQVCMSTTDVAFYVVDAHMWGFREACAEHHLQKGQGVTGRAFELHKACFCADITQFSKTDYPLVHYARMFGLSSCFAICLRSSHTGDDDYVLEFFLPPNITGIRDQQNLLESLLETMTPHFRSLSSASGKELELEWRSMEMIRASMDEKIELKPTAFPISTSTISPVSISLRNGNMVHHGTEEQQLAGGYSSLNGEGNIDCKAGSENVVFPSETKIAGKKPEKKRGKAEKTISLEVLQQYFAGSLKDAAKSLGVCPTTMKRICRQHGISRWPSRKINKVNRSLSKLKRVIESVQGSDGTFTLTSLASSSLPVDANPMSWPANMNGLCQQDSPGSNPFVFHDDKNDLSADKAPGYDEHADETNQLINGRVSGDEGSHGSKTGSGSGEESAGTPISHPSFRGSPAPLNQCSPTNDVVVSPANYQRFKVGGSVEFPCQANGEINLSAVFSTPDAFVSSRAQQPFHRMPIEDVGSSHDLRNLSPAGEGMFDERQQEYSFTNNQSSNALHKDNKDSPPDQKPSPRPEMKTITIKASYREDIIRFRLSLESGIDILKEEVAKRLKLELGTFEIKYLDDDHEWVLIACDADLQECVDISRSSGYSIIRLLVHDMMTNLGSSCESSGE